MIKKRKKLLFLIGMALSAAFVAVLFLTVDRQNVNQSIGTSVCKSGKGVVIQDEETPQGSKPKKTVDENYVISDYDKQIIGQCNAQRVAAGQAAIPVSTRLCKDAAVRAEETSRLWEHTRPDGSDWWTLDEKYMNGENIAYGYTSSAENVSAWVNSPHHYENMIRARFKSCGCYTYIASDGTTYTVFEYSDSGPAA